MVSDTFKQRNETQANCARHCTVKGGGRTENRTENRELREKTETETLGMRRQCVNIVL